MLNCARNIRERKILHVACGLFTMTAPLAVGCMQETYLTRVGSKSSVRDWKEIKSDTSVDLLRAKLGPPGKIEKFGDNEELWTYGFTEQSNNSCSLFFILYSNEDAESHTCSAVYEIRDGKVVAGPVKK